MNKPIHCGVQDMLEAAIVQSRRLNLICHAPSGEQIFYDRVLPIDIGSKANIETLTILTTDNDGGILKLSIKTAEIVAFEAKDFHDPRIKYQK